MPQMCDSTSSIAVYDPDASRISIPEEVPEGGTSMAPYGSPANNHSERIEVGDQPLPTVLLIPAESPSQK